MSHREFRGDGKTLETVRNNKQNLHTHTTYVDGKDSPEEMILKAMERGFGSIGFSEHSYLRYSTFPRQMTETDAVRYKEEIQALKTNYRGKIDIFCGLELDFFSEVPTDGFDYIIGSVHYLDARGSIATFDRGLPETRGYIDAYFDGDAMAFAKTYFETVARLPEKTQIDILGHFDLLTKNNNAGRFIDVSSKAYLDAGFEAIAALKGKIPLFEVNTGAIGRGYKTAPYPQTEFLKEFHRQGFGVVITSDCHDKNFIDCFFTEAEEWIRSAGFQTKWLFTENGFQEVRL